MKQFTLLILALAAACLTQCHRTDPGPTKPEDQLPPATQVGAGTFGCLVNGQPWTPAGHAGHPNFILTYDSGYGDGSLQVKCYRYTGNRLEGIIFGGGHIKQAGTYVSSPSSPVSLSYSYTDNSIGA